MWLAPPLVLVPGRGAGGRLLEAGAFSNSRGAGTQSVASERQRLLIEDARVPALGTGSAAPSKRIVTQMHKTGRPPRPSPRRRLPQVGQNSRELLMEGARPAGERSKLLQSSTPSNASVEGAGFDAIVSRRPRRARRATAPIQPSHWRHQRPSSSTRNAMVHDAEHIGPSDRLADKSSTGMSGDGFRRPLLEDNVDAEEAS